MTIEGMAVLVDGDNVSADHAPRILSHAKGFGRVDVARVYAAGSSKWLQTPGYRYIHAGCGKNSADIVLSMDAIELALVSGFRTFLIATSDGDFFHVVQRLRERSLRVIGLGGTHASESFRVACSEFRTLPAPDCGTVRSDPTACLSDFDRKIRSIIKQHDNKGRGMRLADLGSRMGVAHGTRISTHPEGNWRAYLTARPSLYQVDPRGPEAMVRFIPQGFAAG